MFGAFGRAIGATCISFVSQAAIDDGIAQRLNLARMIRPVTNTRGGIGKKDMIHNDATPHIEVDPETYEVRADGEILTCEPAATLPMTQRYFLF
jgi:urease subunit alpha